MRRILIAGCGYVGVATADLFHRAGWKVEGWTLSSSAALVRAPYPVRRVDLGSSNAVAGAGGDFDVVVHCASSRGGSAADYRRLYLDGLRNLIAAFPRARLLFTSSTSVYAQTNGEWVTELSPAEPTRETGRILLEAEGLALRTGGVVARLAGIYGPGRSALLHRLLEGTAVIDPGTRFINQAHRDDIAAALLLLVRQFSASRPPGESAPRLYNVSDDNPISQRDCYAWLAAQLRMPVPPTTSSAGERKRGAGNKRVSSEKLRACGWKLRYPTFQIAMTESILPALQRNES